jgi:glutathione S-transferase
MTVPVLVTPDGVIGDSADILAWVDASTPPEHRLFPSVLGPRDKVERLCRRLDEVLGPSGRRLMYVHMLADPKLALRFNNAGVPGWEDRFIRYGWPLAQRYVKRVLDIRPGIEVQDEAAVFGEFDYVAEQLCDGRPYLCGEQFSAADLTFASLSASVIVPPTYGVPLPQPDVLSPGMAALVERARDHPAGRYALKLFTEHRRERVL